MDGLVLCEMHLLQYFIENQYAHLNACEKWG